jgi:SPP1 family predicted phage head-tail adaptor
MQPVSAGRLNRQVTIRSAVPARDAIGQPLPPDQATWQDVCTVWADIEAPRPRETAMQVAAGEVSSSAAYVVRIRRRTDLAAAMRVHVDGFVLRVVQVVADIAGREWTHLMCVDDGQTGAGT